MFSDVVFQADEDRTLETSIEACLSGTREKRVRFWSMTISLSQLLEESFRIAWDYLDRTGELGDRAIASRFLSDNIGAMIRKGQRSRLLVSNRAIGAYQRHLAVGKLEPGPAARSSA